MPDNLVTRLRNRSYRLAMRDMNGDGAALALEAANKIERLQKIIDSRPAINAGLPETYIKWSQSIYAMETLRVLEDEQ